MSRSQIGTLERMRQEMAFFTAAGLQSFSGQTRETIADWIRDWKAKGLIKQIHPTRLGNYENLYRCTKEQRS